MSEAITDVESAPAVQVFGVQEVVKPGFTDLETVMQQRLVLTAFEQGYGLVEKPKRTTWSDSSFGVAHDVVRFSAMGVKLHG